MTSDEAVEAAAIAMSECGAEGWEDQGEHFKGVMRRDARLALEAAAPHMLERARVGDVERIAPDVTRVGDTISYNGKLYVHTQEEPK